MQHARRRVTPGFLGLASSLIVGLWGATTLAAPSVSELEKMAARFAPVDVEVDVSQLPAEERDALVRLIEASRVIDALFLRQRSPGNDAVLLELLSDTTSLGRARLDYFLLNKGPWSELDEDRVFVPGAGAKPEGANFYPPAPRATRSTRG